MKKSKKWIKPRHTLYQKLTKIVLYFIVKFKYGVKITKCKDKRQKLILSNHQTVFDQFFVAYGYKTPLYYLASEDIFSNGFISKLLRYSVNPIPIKKQTSDVKAVMNCLRVAKEGGSIAIFPEGNRTYSGTTENISIAIVKLVKTLKLPIYFFRIEGGYGIQPRWSDKTRKGKMKAYTLEVMEPEEYVNLSDEQLYDIIKTNLYVDEREIVDTYKSKRSAEYLDRLLYVCPYCKLAEFTSEKDKVKCTKCNREIIYQPNKQLKGVGFDLPFKFVKEWYDYQQDFINNLDLTQYTKTPMFTDTTKLFNVVLYKHKKKMSPSVKVKLFGNRFEIDDTVMNFDDVSSVSVLGRNKLNVHHNGTVYQLKGGKHFNAVKYVNVFYRYKNVLGGTNGKFLGL